MNTYQTNIQCISEYTFEKQRMFWQREKEYFSWKYQSYCINWNTNALLHLAQWLYWQGNPQPGTWLSLRRNFPHGLSLETDCGLMTKPWLPRGYGPAAAPSAVCRHPVNLMEEAVPKGHHPAWRVSVTMGTAGQPQLTILLLISWKWISQTFSTTSSFSKVTKPNPV